MQIVISNVYSDDNRGGAALTSAAIQAVQSTFPGAKVTLLTFGQTPDELSASHRHTLRDHPDVDVRPALLRTSGRGRVALALLQSCLLLAMPRAVSRRLPGTRPVATADLVIGKGGQMLRTRDRSGLIALWFAMFPLVLGARMGIPTVVYGQAFGPFSGGRGQKLTARLLRDVRMILLRDAQSMRIAEDSHLLPPKVRQIPDTVFGLDWPSSSDSTAVAARYGLATVPFAAVTVTYQMDTPVLRERTLKPLADVVRGLLDANLVERVAIVVQTDGKTSDAAASKSFRALCADERVCLVDDDLSWRELSALYGHARVVIGGRVHSNILALLAGTPAMPIDFNSDKAADIFATFGMADRVVRLDRQSPSVVVEMVEKVLADERATRDEVARVRTELREASRDAYGAFHDLVQGTN